MKKRIDEILQRGGIVVYPTDTLYGMLASARNRDTVEKLYAIRKRDLHKPFILLIPSTESISEFCSIDGRTMHILKKIWPAKISVVLQCKEPEWDYLHRGTQSLAFRVPADARLRALLKRTGPLVAPTANKQGEEPARTAEEAKKIFGQEVQAYIEEGKKQSEPSTLIEIRHGEITVLREGADFEKIKKIPIGNFSKSENL